MDYAGLDDTVAFFLTITVSVERPPAIVGGKRSATPTALNNIKASPLFPITADIQERVLLETPHERLQCFVEGGHAIKEGNTLVHTGARYAISAVEDWPQNSSAFQVLIVEQAKR
jgi:hypothetical protein